MNKEVDDWQKQREERYRNRHKHDSEQQSSDCKHEMIYSSTLGVVGGYCRKCGYKTY